MGIELITERHAAQIEGVLGCWDRMLVFGTVPRICYAEGMTSYLYANHVRGSSRSLTGCQPAAAGWRVRAAARFQDRRRR
ncbi:MAG: hypothetical protein ABSG79_21415 [Bryobacteraceae bacterium]